MAHATIEQLDDLAPVLAEIRRWPDVREPRPGVFYIKRTAFLHFHVKGERRWADLRTGPAWGPELDLPIPLSHTARDHFVRTLREAHAETHATVVRPRRPS